MCGFAGYRLFKNYKPVQRDVFERISRTLFHRGPDDAGMWEHDDKSIGLVARRLSIIDLSPAAAQPMLDTDKTIVMAFNGEIYNFKILRKQLEQEGYIFRSHSDTEVFLNAFKKWGVGCLHRLDGMFAAVIYDKKSDELYLIRDRIGIKPLYFSLQANAIVFASEIKALWHFPWMNKRISYRAISHYLTFLATPAPATLYDGVYKLPAGFYAKIDMHGEISFSQWYDPLEGIPTTPEAEFQKKSWCVTTVRSLLTDAVRKRMVADVPVGAFLSGGLDSSLIVALMVKQTQDLKTFNVSFEHDPQEERSWARKIAKKFSTDHHELILSEQDAFSFFEKMSYIQDEPLGDSVCIPLYFVSKLARDTGVKVVQIGEGADELFCGYPMYVDYIKIHRYWQLSQYYVPQAARQGLYFAARPFYGHAPNRQDMLRSWSENRSLFWGGVRVFSQIWKDDILQELQDDPFDPIIEKIYPGFPQTNDSYLIADYHRKRCFELYPQADFFSMMTYLELKNRLPELLLARTDKMTMAASIEARVPYLDYRLVEMMLRVPMSLKYFNHETKFLLKKVAEGLLPQEVIYRKKVGFSAPVTQWFKKGTLFPAHLSEQIRSNTWQDIFDTQTIDALIQKNKYSSTDYSYQLWALQNIVAFQ